MNIFIAIIALSFLIIIHELGHFIAARLAGIKVLEFSIFMGPKLFSIKRGETVYSIRAIPIGGYVKMEGEDEASDDMRAFNRKKRWVRALVLFAGPFMNILMAFIIIFIMSAYGGYFTDELVVRQDSPAYDAGIRSGDRILSYDDKKIYHRYDMMVFMNVSGDKPVTVKLERNENELSVIFKPEKITAHTRYLLGFIPKELGEKDSDSNVVESVTPSGATGDKSLRAGDRIVALNEVKINNRFEIAQFMDKNKDKPLNIIVIREGKTVTIEGFKPSTELTPEYYDAGMDFASTKGNINGALKYSGVYTFSIGRSAVYTIIWLIKGNVSINQLLGPVGIVTTLGDVVEQSPDILSKVLNLLSLMAFISISLGIFNLIPFPALDGGKLTLIGVEAVTRKPIPPEKEAIISMIGFALLIILLVFTVYNDILRQATGS
jgi:regulator of sigma E protease